MTSPLSVKLRNLALHGGTGQQAHLTDLADKFDAAIIKSVDEPSQENLKKMLGCWARARRAYCDLMGEGLI